MKKTVIGLILSVILFVSCTKKDGNGAMFPAHPSIAAKWSVDSVNLSFYDAAGLNIGSEIGYPIAGGLNYPLFFQFNNDSSWSELLAVPPNDDVISKGTYSYTSSNTFNLIYPDASPAQKNEPCNILSLTNNSFIFSKQLPTIFNGTDSGSIKYVFRLRK